MRDSKTLNLSRNIVSLRVLVDVSRFSPCMISLICNKNICCGLKKCSTMIDWFARARADLLSNKLWVWWKTSNKAKLCCSKYIRALLFAATLFNSQQMFLLHDKLITEVKKKETSTKTCNETMLRDKLRVFVSRILQLIRRNMLRACCVMLRHDGCSWLKCETGQIFHGTFVKLHDFVVIWLCLLH